MAEYGTQDFEGIGFAKGSSNTVSCQTTPQCSDQIALATSSTTHTFVLSTNASDHVSSSSASSSTKSYKEQSWNLSPTLQVTATAAPQPHMVANLVLEGKTNPLMQPTSSPSVEAEAQSARLRAMEILRKFQGPNHYNTIAPSDTSNNSNTKNQLPSCCDLTSSSYTLGPPSELARKQRQDCLERLKQREHAALLKNLEYLTRIQDVRLQHQLDQVQNAKAHEEQVLFRYKNFHKNRIGGGGESQGINSMKSQSQAGIGTDQRQRVEEKRKRNAPHESTADSVAIYVANLPQDRSTNEELLRGLFASYGHIRKIHFYVDKKTGEPKGDALVIYSLEQNNKTELTQSVCSQLNGCELPGSDKPLLVQPSDPLHKLRKKKVSDDVGNCGPSISNCVEDSLDSLPREESVNKGEQQKTPDNHSGDVSKPTQQERSEEGDDILDDFFASLE